MRKTVRKQISKYLLVAWVVGVASLIFATWYTHGTIHTEDWQTVFFVAALTGGVMWSMLDFWVFEEKVQSKKRIMRGVTSRRG